MTESRRPRVWAIVPAAGSGSRMVSDIPKQYLHVAGRRVAEHTLDALLAVESITAVVVALSGADRWWPLLPATVRERVMLAPGGDSRAQSVLSALKQIRDMADDNDWALVHDMARPCLQAQAIAAFIETLRDDAVGGLLAIPVVDTLKRADREGRVAETVDREGLWRAQTPQMFRFGMLLDSLHSSLQAGLSITDEASAIEAAGARPRLVAGPADNIKITVPADLELAGRVLADSEEGA